MKNNLELSVTVKEAALNSLEWGSASLIRLSGHRNPLGTLEAFVGDPERYREQVNSDEAFTETIRTAESKLSANGVILTEVSDINANLISLLYKNYGTPIYNIMVDCNDGTTYKNILMFGNGQTNRRFVPWEIYFLGEEQHRLTELAAKLKNPASSVKLKKEVTLAVQAFHSMNRNSNTTLEGVFTDDGFHWVMDKKKLDPSKSRKQPLNSIVTLPAKEYKAEIKTLEKIAKPEGLDVTELGSNIPSRVLRYIVDVLTPKNGIVADLDSVTGDVGHACLELVNAKRPDVRCVAVSEEDESFTLDRLEALSNGAWKNWTYHDPAEHGFQIEA